MMASLFIDINKYEFYYFKHFTINSSKSFLKNKNIISKIFLIFLVKLHNILNKIEILK